MAAKKGVCSVKEAIFNHSKLIYSYVSVQHLIAEFANSKLEFLTPNEFSRLFGGREFEPRFELPGRDHENARKLLVYLKQQSSQSLRKFVASLVLERHHMGHHDISKAIMGDLDKRERLKVLSLVNQVVQDYDNEYDIVESCTTVHGFSEQEMLISFSSYDTDDDECKLPTTSTSVTTPGPPRPPPFINLIGRLENSRFEQLDRKLWSYFATGQYDNLKLVVDKLQRKEDALDYKIVGMWFNSLISMHRDKNYQDCLTKILFPALELCSDEKTQNPTILRGRILLRISQVYLVDNRKDEAAKYFSLAEQELQHVGKCYETVNMHCRRAKLLSTSCRTAEDRERTEREFSLALSAFSDDDSFALASKPSLVLSKTAFHLRISFGVQPMRDNEPPIVRSDDICKAKATLKQLPDDMIHLDMRKFEKKLVGAELERLQGNPQSALECFESIAQDTSVKNIPNLKAIANNRICDIHKKNDEMKDLLEGLP